MVLDRYAWEDFYVKNEEFGTVAIFNTCDEARRKIRASQKRPGCNQPRFLGGLARCRPLPKGKRKPQAIAGSTLKRFLELKGPSQGYDSPVFYTAYVFFEKKRIKDRSNKTKLKQEMEGVWGKYEDRKTGRKGFLISRKAKLLCREDEVAVEDKCGMIRIQKKPAARSSTARPPAANPID